MKTFRYIGLVKSRVVKLLLCFTVTLIGAALPVVAMPFTNVLPWSESFETYTNGLILGNTNGWATATNNQAVVTNVGASACIQGTNICYLPSEGVLTNLINSASASVVWYDMFAKISLRETHPAVDASATSMFYFNTNGHAVVQDGPTSNWVALASNMFSAAVTPITATNWTRLTVVHNYTDKKWALFVGGKLLKDNIRFINSANSMSAMVVSNQVYLDSMIATATYPTNGQVFNGQVFASNTVFTSDADGDSMLDYVELNYFKYASTQDGGDDADGDGRSNASELARATDPTNPSHFSLVLPFRDGFESATNGLVTTNYWRGLTNFGTIAVSASQYIEGGKSLGVHTGAVHVIVNDGTASNVWVQIYSKVQPFTDVPANNSLTTNEVMGFFVLTNGNLYAYNGNHWTNTAAVPSVGTNLWLGFAVHLDYNARQYDLYVSTDNIHGAIMKRAHTNYLAFNTIATAPTALSKVVVTNEAAGYAYIDAIAVSRAYTNTGVQTLTNMLAYDRFAGQTTMAQMPPYNYAAGENLVTNKLGQDLRRELAAGDKLHIYATNGWNVYYLETNWLWQCERGLTNLEVNAAMGMQIQRVGVGVDAVAFYPYSNVVAMTQDVTIFGTNDATTVGWNLLTSPFSQIRYPTNYDFQGAVAGDAIYLAGKRIYFTGPPSSRWKEDNNAASNALLPGATFWYYHSGTGMVWNVAP